MKKYEDDCTDILLLGTKMSNILYNLSQVKTIDSDVRGTMKKLIEEWDKVRMKHPVVKSKES